MQHSKITRWLATAALAASMSSAVLADSLYTGLFIFGDSLSDSGNIAALIGANPGQVISGNSYVPSQPYGSGTFSNGAVWVNSFAASIGLAASALPSLGGGGNFAFGGARTATDGSGLPPSLSAQAGQFLSAHGGVAPGGALYVVEGGGNDARDALAAAAASATPGAVILAAAATYAQNIGIIVDQLQAAGAQHIVVWDVPNLATAPAVTALGAGATFLGGQVSQAMNTALGVRLATEPGVSIFDLYGLVNGVVANPGAFGIVNVTDACGAVAGCVPGSYLFWDGIHPTSAGHQILASAMLSVVPEPAAAPLMLLGLLGVVAVARRRAASAATRQPAPAH